MFVTCNLFDPLVCNRSFQDWTRWAVVEKRLYILFMLAASCVLFLLVKLSTSDKSEIDFCWLVLLPHCLLDWPEPDTSWLIWSDLICWELLPDHWCWFWAQYLAEPRGLCPLRWSQEDYPPVSVKFFLVKFMVGFHYILYTVRYSLVCFLSNIQEEASWVYLCCSWGENTVKLLNIARVAIVNQYWWVLLMSSISLHSFKQKTKNMNTGNNSLKCQQGSW